MQQSQHYISSVSDLYRTDEIELLLEEIRVLEPVCCQLDDDHEFEIAGSRAGELSLSLESPLGTCTSWDSHANYRQCIDHAALPWGVTLHCDPQHLKTPTGIVRILLVLTSAACLIFECSAGTVQVGLFLLPLIGRLRLMIFCTLFSLLITCLMIFLEISHIVLMFPFNWTKINTWMYLSIGLIFILSSTLFMHMVFFAEEFIWVSNFTKYTLFTSGIIGYICAIESLMLSSFTKWSCTRYWQMHEECSEIYIEDREMTPINIIESPHINLPSLYETQKSHKVFESTISNEAHSYHQLHQLTNKSSFSYTPAKRPNKLDNQKPTLGYLQNINRTNIYREGYHYQPVSTSDCQSPSFTMNDGNISKTLTYQLNNSSIA